MTRILFQIFESEETCISSLRRKSKPRIEIFAVAVFKNTSGYVKYLMYRFFLLRVTMIKAVLEVSILLV